MYRRLLHHLWLALGNYTSAECRFQNRRIQRRRSGRPAVLRVPLRSQSVAVVKLFRGFFSNAATDLFSDGTASRIKTKRRQNDSTTIYYRRVPWPLVTFRHSFIDSSFFLSPCLCLLLSRCNLFIRFVCGQRVNSSANERLLAIVSPRNDPWWIFELQNPNCFFATNPLAACHSLLSLQIIFVGFLFFFSFLFLIYYIFVV